MTDIENADGNEEKEEMIESKEEGKEDEEEVQNTKENHKDDTKAEKV